MSNNKQAIPVVQDDTLIYWSNGQDYRLTVGTLAWHAWLSSATTFAFRGEGGTFTARREQAGHKRGAGIGVPTAGIRASSTESI